MMPCQDKERCASADQQHGDGAERGALGRRKDAAVDAADDHQRDQQDRPDGGQRRRRSPTCDRRGRREVRAPAHARPGDRDAVEQRRHQARDERGLEQLGDVLLGGDGIDDQDDGGRDEDAERAADGDGAGGEAGVVAGSACSSGSAARPKVAVVATEEPQMAPNAVQAQMTAIASPPRMRPANASAA